MVTDRTDQDLLEVAGRPQPSRQTQVLAQPPAPVGDLLEVDRPEQPGHFAVGVYDRQDRAENDGAEPDADLAVLASLLERLQVRWSYWHGHAATGLRGFLDATDSRTLTALLTSAGPWLPAHSTGSAVALFRQTCRLATSRDLGLICATDLRIAPPVG